MITFFKKIFKEWDATMKEISAMGITTHPWGSWFNKEQYETYLKYLNQESKKK